MKRKTGKNHDHNERWKDWGRLDQFQLSHYSVMVNAIVGGQSEGSSEWERGETGYRKQLILLY